MVQEMRRDKEVFLIGEDIGTYGGAFGVSKGMLEEFGPERIRETPISEAAIAGAATGAALMGMRPVMEIMFMDFLTISMNQLVNQAAKMRFMFGGKCSIPMVIRAPAGSGTGAAAQHSQSLEAWFVNVPGIKVVAPSTPYDAKGLLIAAIRDNNPVLFMEHKLLYRIKGPVPEEAYCIPLQSAEVKREGRDLTIVAYSIMVPRALEAAEKLAAEGIEVEVVDPRCLKPLDEATIVPLGVQDRPGADCARGADDRRLWRRTGGCDRRRAKPLTIWMPPSAAWPGGISRSPTTGRLNGPLCRRSRILSPRRARWRRRESSHGNRSDHAQSRYGHGDGHLCRMAQERR